MNKNHYQEYTHDELKVEMSPANRWDMEHPGRMIQDEMERRQIVRSTATPADVEVVRAAIRLLFAASKSVDGQPEASKGKAVKPAVEQAERPGSRPPTPLASWRRSYSGRGRQVSMDSRLTELSALGVATERLRDEIRAPARSGPFVPNPSECRPDGQVHNPPNLQIPTERKTS